MPDMESRAKGQPIRTPYVSVNKMESFNGELRDREKVMRSLKTEDSPILKGLQIYHNYFRPHMGLDGKTPAEASGIIVEGENPWVTVIQNASQESASE
jgi:putative transposase